MVQSMAQPTQSETTSGLPVLLGPGSPRPSLARSSASAAFVSQLIAARDRMPAQRPRRQSTQERAIGAYANGARMTERRMPAGYRKSLTA